MRGGGRACTPHPHQPGLILPSWLNVRQKEAVATLCNLSQKPSFSERWFFNNLYAKAEGSRLWIVPTIQFLIFLRKTSDVVSVSRGSIFFLNSVKSWHQASSPQLNGSLHDFFRVINWKALVYYTMLLTDHNLDQQIIPNNKHFFPFLFIEGLPLPL